MFDYSPEFRMKIQKEYDEVISKSAFWAEFIKNLTSLRYATARSLESKKLDSLANIAEHVETKGEISGYDKVIRMFKKILDRESL